MLERGFAVEDLEEVIASGQTIEDYPEDFPFPSRLILGSVESRAIHVVAAFNSENDEAIIITVYEPNPENWNKDFTRRNR